jgi:raffinose/stachyose/melibiose transport system substrate-binding protein
MLGRRQHRSFAFLLAGAFALASCLPGGGDEPDATTDDPGAEEPGEDAAGGDAAEGDVTLVVWDHYARGVEGEVVETLNAEFEEEHGVTIQRESRTLDDLNATLGLAMRDDEGPDIASVNQGRADMGALVEAGLLMDLSDFGQERGWYDDFSENLLNRNMFTEDGQTFGEGNLYGIAPQAEVVGWYYNRDTFEEQGLEPPETFDELEQLLSDLAEADQTPITFGNLDGWPGIHTYGAIQHVFVDTDYLNDFVFARGGASFDRPENIEAAEVAQSWVEAGYFTANLEGIGYDDSWAMFAAGDGATMLTGSWISGELDQEQFGFFLTPSDTAGQIPPQVGGQGVPFGVRAGTAHPELAREYVDWMVSERAAELWAEAGALPSRTPPDGAVAEGSLLSGIIAAWEQVIEQNQTGHYLDWATPTFYDTITAELQELFTLSVEPQQFVDNLEADYQQFVG